MKEVKLTIDGDRPGLPEKCKAGVRILITEEDPRKFLFDLQNALVALYEHEAHRLGFAPTTAGLSVVSFVATEE